MKHQVLLFSALIAMMLGLSTACSDDKEEEIPPVPVSEVSLDKTELTLIVGETAQIIATVTPDNAQYDGITFTSTATDVATVDAEGNITAIAAGKTDIIALAGGKSAVCKVTVNNKDVPQTIYAVGYSDALEIAYWWKSGETKLAELSAENARANSIFVADNGTVYIGGEYTNAQDFDNYFAAALWVNGELQTLSDKTRPTTAAVYGIDVDGNDVWCAGFYRYQRNENWSFQRDAAVLWKNGNIIKLTKGENYAKLYDVKVSGGKVYAVGESTDKEGMAIATLWVNDNTTEDWSNVTKINLSDGTVDTYAESLCVDGNDVYVAGLSKLPGNNRIQYAVMWKNGEMEYLTKKESYATSICVENGHVYVAGWEYLEYENGPCAVATVWVDGVAQHLTDERKSSQARCVAVKNGNVYVSGFLGNSAAIWKNGNVELLSDGAIPVGITSIFITEP